MATQKPISTISYNTEEFLVEKLNALLKAHIVQAYQYIFHFGEEGDKDHFHVRLELNRAVDPMDLTDMFKEYVIGSEKPLGVRPWRHSKEEDWLLYAVHNEDYLRIKYGGADVGEKMPYSVDDIKVSEGFDIGFAFRRALGSLQHTQAGILRKMREGKKPSDLVAEGENVFVANAIARAMAQTDLEPLTAENRRLRFELDRREQYIDAIFDAIEKAGFCLFPSDNGSYTLEQSLFPIDEEKMKGGI